MKFVGTIVLLVLFGLGLHARAEAKVTVEQSDDGAIVKIDGKLFAEYLAQSTHQPCIWPTIGPNGKPITRAYPVGPDTEGESRDHIHHHSFWFTHGMVNGHDFWSDTSKRSDPSDRNRIVHREFVALEEVGDQAKIVTVNDWMHGEEEICEDQRVFLFGADETARWIDCTITIKATEGDVVFGDTKEGAFAVRVADSMKVEAGKGGKIVNREGLTNEEAWGVPSRWVDYSGPVNGDVVGIAMLSHPESFRPEVRWHVREYGLFAANPFGQRDFPDAGLQQGAFTIPKGTELTLRYRVFLHPGGAIQGKVEEAYRNYAGEP